MVKLKKKIKLLNQQQRRSAKSAAKWSAKAKAKGSYANRSKHNSKAPITVENVDQRMAIQRTAKDRYLTVESRISLSLRRNCSNVACADLGLVLLDDVSRWTIARAEVQTGAALIGHARAFHQTMLSEFEDQSRETPHSGIGVSFHCISQDATNGSIWQKRKLVALLLHTAYCPLIPKPGDNFSGAWTWKWDMFTSSECIADVQPVADGSSRGSVGLTHKTLQSLGCPSAWNLLEPTTTKERCPPQAADAKPVEKYQLLNSIFGGMRFSNCFFVF